MKESVDRQNRLRLGKAIYDLDTSQLIDQEGRPIAIRAKSLRLLDELAVRNNETLEKDSLIGAVWEGRSVSDDSLVQCIKDIRAVLGDNERQILRTAIGRGYSLHGLREMPIGPGEPPKLLISRLSVRGNGSELIELSDNIIEELIVSLSPRAGLIVTSDEDQRETTQYTINGRISLSGNSVRVFIQILRTPSGEVVFAETWTVPAIENHVISRQIADKVDNMLRIHMFNHVGKDHVDCQNDELDTQELLSKAAYHMSRIQMQNRNVARDALSLAIEREPTNAMALAMRASTAVLLVLQDGISKVPDSPEYCLEMADRAVSLAPHVDYVMLTRGCVRLWLWADHEGARADFLRALEVSPVFHLAHQFLSISEILSGDQGSGILRMKKIMDLGTVTNPRYPHYLALLALGQILAGDANAALQSSREGHERAPKDPWCNYVYAAAAAHREKITITEPFQRMIASIGLPFCHFRELPFTNSRDVELLEERLILAGYPRTP